MLFQTVHSGLPLKTVFCFWFFFSSIYFVCLYCHICLSSLSILNTPYFFYPPPISFSEIFPRLIYYASYPTFKNLLHYCDCQKVFVFLTHLLLSYISVFSSLACFFISLHCLNVASSISYLFSEFFHFRCKSSCSQ